MAKYKGRDDVTEPWEEVFLREYVERGGKMLSAKTAGTTWPRVARKIEESPRFAQAYEAAHAEMLETLERRLMALSAGAKGNFLAIIARLKAELPAKYNDKLQVSGAVAHLHAAPAPDVVATILREMLLDARPETLKQIGAGEVVEAEPVS